MNKVSIDANTTQEYKLVISYANLSDVDQSEDMGKELSFRINIDEAIDNYLTNAEDGTLLAAMGENNFISEPLTVPGKSLSGYKYVETEVDNSEKQITLNPYNTYGYWKYGTGFEYDEANGYYHLTGVTTSSIPYSEMYTELVGKYVVGVVAYSGWASSYEQAQNIEIDKLNKVYQIVETTSTTVTYKIVASRTTNYIDEAVLGSTEDDYGDSYYYRGDVRNNFVTYSGMCWRIVRTDGNGNIKLVLADENNACGPNSDTGYSTDNATSAFVNEATRYAYKATPTNTIDDVIYETSDIPAVLETWANREGKALDTSKLVTTEWCNDTSISSEEATDTEGVVRYNFGAYDRLAIFGSEEPNLKCTAVGLNNSNAIKYAGTMGLLTADEIAFAGAKFEGEGYEDNYLFSNALWKFGYWTMTPAYISSSAYMFAYGRANNSFYNYEINNSNFIRPAVVLRSDVQVTGNGTQESPYVVS